MLTTSSPLENAELNSRHGDEVDEKPLTHPEPGGVGQPWSIKEFNMYGHHRPCSSVAVEQLDGENVESAWIAELLRFGEK